MKEVKYPGAVSYQTLKQIREKQRANSRAYRERMKDNPQFKGKERERWSRWYTKKKAQRQLELEKTSGRGLF